MSGTGSLTTVHEVVGGSGLGVFTQTGGTHTVTGPSSLILGDTAGSSGTYSLSAGSLAAINEIVGNSGTGTFTQSGGTNTVSNTLTLAAVSGGSGTYTITGGSLAAGAIQVNPNGTFNEQGGAVSGDLTNLGTFNYTSGTFASELFNFGAANFFGNFTAGNGLANYGAITVNPAITLTLNGTGLDNSGTFNLLGGTLAGSGPLVNNLSMSGHGTISGTGGFINNGLFTQSGGPLLLFNTGTNVNYSQIAMAASQSLILGPGVTLDNQGPLTLQNLSLITGSGTLNNTTGLIEFPSPGSQGTINSQFANGGELRLSGGSLTVTQNFSNSGLISLTTADAELRGGGFLTNTGTIRGQGTIRNSLANSGDLTLLGGNMTLTGSSIVNNAGGLITVPTGLELFATNGVDSNAGTILYYGSFNNNNQPLSNSGLISGSGTFQSGTLTNSGTFQMTGGTTLWNNTVNNQAGGSFQIINTDVTFLGNVINSGSLKNTNSAVSFFGGFTNNGAYISDPAVNNFTDLTIGTGGYLVAGASDIFNISNNFTNHSTQNTSWNTTQAILNFVVGSDAAHDFYIPGTDQGATLAGYNNNFALGTLDLTGQTLNLFDGTDTNGGAQYLEVIAGLVLTGLTVDNIIGSNTEVLNLYYDPTQVDNAYLNGLTYAFISGYGHLIPTTTVPVPASVLLFGSGLLGLGLLGWRRQRRG